MKKLFGLLVLIGLVATCLFGGLHIGTPCPGDAMDFAEHIGPDGSDHLPEFGGVDGAVEFLQGVAKGNIQVGIYGDAARTVLTATNSPWGPVLIIYVSSVLPTMYTTTTIYQNNLTRGMPKRSSSEDTSAARTTAGCFSRALQPADIPVRIPANIGVFPIILGAMFVLGILFIGGKKILGGLAA